MNMFSLQTKGNFYNKNEKSLKLAVVRDYNRLLCKWTNLTS
jgi:hypothetical protein